MTKNIIFIGLFIAQSLGATLPVTVQEVGYARAAMHNFLHASPVAYCFDDNFRISVPDNLYRANTLPPQKLSKYIKQFGIKTIVNLRGEHPGAPWWQQELAVAQAHGIEMVNISLLAHEYPPPAELQKLFEVFDVAEIPLMVHCFAGVDRTGTACALWFLEKEGRTLDEAIAQLSFLYYGHWGFVFTNPMQKFIRLWHGLRVTRSRDEAVLEYARMYAEQGLAKKGREHRFKRRRLAAYRFARYPVFGLLHRTKRDA